MISGTRAWGQTIPANHPSLKFCETATQVGAIVSQYPVASFFPTLQTIPNPPFVVPGIMISLATRTSALITLCDMLMNVAAADTQSAIFQSGNYLNDLTDRKFSEDIQLTRDTWSLANQAYDFDSGNGRRGALSSASFHRNLVTLSRDSERVMTGENARLQTRGERQAKLNNLARVAHKRAILKDALYCPRPQTDSNFDNIEKFEVAPARERFERFSQRAFFIKGQLLKMGARFSDNVNELNAYIKEVEALEEKGVVYKVNTTTKVDRTTVAHPDRKNKDGTALTQEKTTSRPIQTWSTMVFAQGFDQFRIKWSPRWNTFVRATWVSSSRGFLNDPEESLRKEFIDYSFECNRPELMRDYDINRADYYEVMDRRHKQCLSTITMNQKKAENLLNYYLLEYQTALNAYKTANTVIWNAESLYLGLNRDTTSSSDSESFLANEVVCPEKRDISPSAMAEIRLKQQAVDVEFKEIIATESMKMKPRTPDEILYGYDNSISKEDAEEMKRREDYVRRQSRDSAENLESGLDLVPFEGGM